MARAAIKTGRYTYADYCTWSDDGRWELIDGVAYAWHLGPAPARSHQQVVRELLVQITLAVKGGVCEAYQSPFDIRLPQPEEQSGEEGTVVQPDISVVCDPSKLDEKGCRGAPDWIIEVLSPSTAAKDHVQKRDTYEKHGVKEYWLVHPVDRIVTIYRLQDGEYGKPDIQAATERTAVAAIPGLEIDWTSLFPE